MLLLQLLLHHVIPGAFKIETLQDEMTGVSLAGTQLRVNQYNMHDLEWNDIKVSICKLTAVSCSVKQLRSRALITRFVWLHNPETLMIKLQKPVIFIFNELLVLYLKMNYFTKSILF